MVVGKGFSWPYFWAQKQLAGRGGVGGGNGERPYRRPGGTNEQVSLTINIKEKKICKCSIN